MPLVDPRHSCRLLVCGDGEDAAAMRGLIAELKLQDRVELMGYRKDIYAVMQGADVLVLPSWYEGMPNVFLEALAIGIPCIVSDIPSHKDLISNAQCAKTFDPRSPEELAARLNEFFGDPGCVEKMVRSGWAIAKAHTPLAMARLHENVYREVVAGRVKAAA
jgi:glycosyltransferase involved in cell wall biosynthesis